MSALAETLRVLGDKTRFAIVEGLLSQDLCVGGLARRLGLSEAAISQQLRILRQAGLVRGEKRGYFVHYEVDLDALRAAAADLAELASASRVRCCDCPSHKGVGDGRTDSHEA